MQLKSKKYGFFDMLTLSIKVSTLHSFLFAAKSLVDALLPMFTIFVTANFLNTAIAVYNNQTTISDIYGSIALLAGIIIYNPLIDVLMNFHSCRQKNFYRRKLRPLIVEKCAKLEYYHIENPKNVDLLNRVCTPFDVNVWRMYCEMIELISLGIYLASIMITLFTQVFWISLTMLIVSVPVIYIARITGLQSYNAGRKLSETDRMVNYLSEVMRSREAVEERSVYGYTEALNARYAEKFELARRFRLKTELHSFVKQKLTSITAAVYSIVAMLILLHPVINGQITGGMFIALMSAILGLSNKLSWGIESKIRSLMEKREYLKDLTEFAALSSCDDAIAEPEKNMAFKLIEFKNVSFKYPDTEKFILDNISFKIENGKHYSFVGLNGAGKTTIIKLITGLYMNYTGEILVDGKSLRELSQQQIKGLTSVVYQDFARYNISLYDNIAIANSSLDNDRHQKVEKVIEIVGLSKAVKGLKSGVDTPLGKVMKGGVELSAGEWQRVAMARGIFSKAPLRILDEPTAALDPLSESEVYKNFEQISRGMTTIFISHRLGSTKLADTIYVIANAKVIESGTHTELMAMKGFYYEMFISQAEWYKNDKEGIKNA